MRVRGFHVAACPTHPEYFLDDQQKVTRLREIAPFFDDPARLDDLVDLTENSGAKGVSLRDIDYLVTHVAPNTRPVWWHDGTMIELHTVYRSQLKTWKRTLFDCFRRYERVFFVHRGVWRCTTPAQLNFFHFAASTGLVAYARANAAAIHAQRRTKAKPVCRGGAPPRMRAVAASATVSFGDAGGSIMDRV